MFGGSKHFVYLCIRNGMKRFYGTKYAKTNLKNKGMELEKETIIGMTQEWASEMAIEGKSLEWLKANKKEISRSIANCKRSAKEMREYIVNEEDGRDVSSEEVKKRKAELVEAIELEAELEKIIAKAIDAELDKRLETK